MRPTKNFCSCSAQSNQLNKKVAKLKRTGWIAEKISEMQIIPE
jgi:hypothetical protein